MSSFPVMMAVRGDHDRRAETVVYALAKTGLYQGLRMSLDDVLNMEARNQAIAARTADRAEGVAAVREKRPPRFTGRAGSSPPSQKN